MNIFFSTNTEFLSPEKTIDFENNRISYYTNLYLELNLTIQEMNKLDLVAKNIGTKTDYLLDLIIRESKLNPQAINKNTKAIGLIQFMPSTLKGMGYNYSDVQNMNILQQLSIIEKYFSYFSNLNNPISLGLACFYPYALQYLDNDEYIFGSERSIKYAHKIAMWNSGYDLNKDGFITILEFKNY